MRASRQLTATWTVLAALTAGVFGELNPSVQAQASIYQRATSGSADIGGAKSKRYGGQYVIGGASSICGEIPKESSLTGVATFIVEFSGGGPRSSVTSIAFGSKALVGGVTQTNAFTLNVHVVNADGGRPPAYVLNTDRAGTAPATVSGKAILTNTGGVAVLDVAGVNEVGETITLRLTCK